MQSSFWLITSISTTQIYALPTGDCCSNSTEERVEERERERAQGVYLDEKIFFLLAFELLHWNVQGTVHVWQGYVIHLATNENLLSSCYIHMRWVCVISPFQSKWLKWTFYFLFYSWSYCAQFSRAHYSKEKKKTSLINFLHWKYC